MRALPRMIMKKLQGRVAEAALRQIEDALERKIIGGLRDTAQIGERIADLGALVKSRAADHPVGQAKRDEALLEFAHLERGAHKNRDLVERMALALQLLDLFADHAGFFFRIPNAGDGRLLAQRAIGEERLAKPPLIMRDETRGRGEDMAGRAVIALEPDDFRARKIALEAQNIIDLGAPPAIDRLIVVADAADIVAPLGEQPQPQILGGVGVLIFIDEHIAEAVLIEFQDLGIFAKEPQGFEQKIAEIGGVEGLQPLLIELIERRALAIGESRRLARGHVRNIEAAVFPGIDLMGEGARGPALVVDIFGLQNLFQ